MVWLAVNKDGTETLHPEEPFRDNEMEWTTEKVIYVQEGKEVYVNTTVKLPKGSIYKLIGVELTWENEPIVV